MTYTTETRVPQSTAEPRKDSHGILELPYRFNDIALSDDILKDVKTVWETIMGDDAMGIEFMRFAERTQHDDESDI